MSIYFLRHGNLVKIGFSEHLAKRVRSIISGIPGEVSFIGHMPGGRDVEAHLHSRFEAQRFSGEWFLSCPDIETFAHIALDPTMPEQCFERVLGSMKEHAKRDALDAKEKLRAYALARWPGEQHEQRQTLLAEHLGWRRSRLSCFYHGDGRAVLRAKEAEDIAGLRAFVSALHRPGTPGADE